MFFSERIKVISMLLKILNIYIKLINVQSKQKQKEKAYC